MIKIMNKQLRMVLTILIMATIMAIVAICVRDLESYISFPIAYLVSWILCTWQMKKIKLNMNKEKDNFYAAKEEYDNFIKKYSVELTDEEIEDAPFSTMLKMGLAKGNSLKLENKEQHDKLDELRENYNKTLHEYNKTKNMEITLPPFDDLDDNGNYIGNDINFLIKNDITKDDALDKFHNFSFDELKFTTKRFLFGSLPAKLAFTEKRCAKSEIPVNLLAISVSSRSKRPRSVPILAE